MTRDQRMEKIRDRLRCPECFGRLSPDAAHEDKLECRDCGASFPIVSGVPILLSSRSEKMCEDELSTDTGKRMVSEYGEIQSSAIAHDRRKRLAEQVREKEI